MKLTVKEALEQGYELCGNPSLDWQNLRDIEDLDEDDFEENEWRLAAKEFDTPSISEDDLKEMIAEHMQENWSSETHDDESRVYDSIKEMDLSDVVDRIHEKTSDIKSWKLTDIQLIP